MHKTKVLVIVVFLILGLQPLPAHGVYQGISSVGTPLTLTLVPKNQRDPFCSMVLLTERIVVTAAHCVIADQDSAPNLKFNISDMYVSQPGADIKVDSIGSRVRVARVVTVSNYVNVFKPEVNDRRGQIDDIAFLFLEKPLLKTYSIEVATEAEINSAINQGKLIEHYGYGLQNIDVQDGKPWMTSLPLIDFTGYEDKSKVIYTREGPSAPCPGDSGGPWYLDVNGTKKLAAVMVAASGCRKPGPYTSLTLGTRVYPYLSLMQNAWNEFESDKRESIQEGKYLEAKGCFKLETNAELLYRTLWGYWTPVQSPTGWVDSDKTCPSTNPLKPWVSVSVENQTKVRWHFWEGEKHTYGDIFTWPNSEANEIQLNDKKTTITCVSGKKVKVVSNVKPRCPKGYKLKK